MLVLSFNAPWIWFYLEMDFALVACGAIYLSHLSVGFGGSYKKGTNGFRHTNAKKIAYNSHIFPLFMQQISEKPKYLLASRWEKVIFCVNVYQVSLLFVVCGTFFYSFALQFDQSTNIASSLWVLLLIKAPAQKNPNYRSQIMLFEIRWKARDNSNPDLFILDKFDLVLLLALLFSPFFVLCFNLCKMCVRRSKIYWELLRMWMAWRRFIELIWVELTLGQRVCRTSVASVSFCAPVHAHCFVRLFFACFSSNAIVRLFSVSPVLCCSRRPFIHGKYAIFVKSRRARAHLSCGPFSATAAALHMYLCNIMNGCTLHLTTTRWTCA